MTGRLQPGEFRGPRYWRTYVRMWWHVDVLGHTVSAGPMQPWWLFHCCCGTRIAVPH